MILAYLSQGVKRDKFSVRKLIAHAGIFRHYMVNVRQRVNQFFHKFLGKRGNFLIFSYGYWVEQGAFFL